MAVVVSTENINDAVKPTLDKFIIMIGNICCKISCGSVFADENFIFLVMIVCPFVPQGAIFFVGCTAVGQTLDGFF